MKEVHTLLCHGKLYIWHGDVECSLFPSNSAQKENKYVERAILYALLAGIGIVGSSKISSLLERGLFIEIVGDNDFYSQTDQVWHYKYHCITRNITRKHPYICL